MDNFIKKIVVDQTRSTIQKTMRNTVYRENSQEPKVSGLLSKYFYLFLNGQSDILPDYEYLFLNSSNYESYQIISKGYGVIVYKNISGQMAIEVETPINAYESRYDQITSNSYTAFGPVNKKDMNRVELDVKRRPIFHSDRVDLLQNYLNKYEQEYNLVAEVKTLNKHL